MHILTKIFIVLVSLLAVLLVPLVVVYAYNENSYQARYETAVANEARARKELDSAQARHGAVESRLGAEIAELNQAGALLKRDLASAEAEIRQLQQRLSSAETLRTEVNSKLATLASAVDAGQQLTESLVSELRDLRSTALASERQKIELDERLREVTGQLEVAVAARRALQEELQRLTDEHANALNTVSQYAVRFGTLGERTVGPMEVVPDRDIETTILQVRRDQDQVLAEINAGSRDGVQEGWKMVIADGGTFLGNLRIIKVDINRSTGVVELEDPQRGLVDQGDRVYARKGRP